MPLTPWQGISHAQGIPTKLCRGPFLPNSYQLSCDSFMLFSTFLLHVSRGLRLSLFPCGFCWAYHVIFLLAFLRVSPIHLYFRISILSSVFTRLVTALFHSSSLQVLSCRLIIKDTSQTSVDKNLNSPTLSQCLFYYSHP